MLHVSSLALAALVLVMTVCFLLPIALYYIMFRFAESKLMMFVKGMLAYFTVRFVLEMPINIIISRYTDLSRNVPMYAVDLFLICPLIFVGVNAAAVKRFGKDMNATGHSLMYATGYVTVQNMVEVGFVSVMYFVTLLGIRSAAAQYIVVSDADYVSMSDVVSRSNLVTESIFAEMQTLCDMPASYFVFLSLERLWGIVAYSAMLTVIWLAVKKRGALVPLLATAFGLRMLASLPTFVSDLGLISQKWLSVIMILAVLAVIVAVSVVCWRKWIDCDNTESADSADSADDR